VAFDLGGYFARGGMRGVAWPLTLVGILPGVVCVA
jgi:hypothetical protein